MRWLFRQMKDFSFINKSYIIYQRGIKIISGIQENIIQEKSISLNLLALLINKKLEYLYNLKKIQIY
ncbi:hypothetical protein pb186bvf_010139 [Paramecium bursaria]